MFFNISLDYKQTKTRHELPVSIAQNTEATLKQKAIAVLRMEPLSYGIHTLN